MDRRREPELLFDGDCGFCRGWILRWESSLRGRVRCRPYQEALADHPELDPAALAEAIHFVDEHGAAHRGAEAVLLALARAPEKRWMLWLYRHVPGYALLAERAYSAVARHRGLASKLTRWTVGPHVEPSTYRRTRRLFFLLLGVVYLAAFGSAWGQIVGLMGADGIFPLQEQLERARAVLGDGAWWHVPTLFWWSASDAMLTGVCATGFALALLLAFGLWPRLLAAALWLLYLSIASTASLEVRIPFFAFQWEGLLLEAGLLAVLFAPGGIRPRWGDPRGTARIALWLLRWLLFRLMFLSGAVKWIADEVWRNGTALDYHYWTQPLPDALSHYVDHLPSGFHRASVFVMFAIELGAPFLIVAPRRLRNLGCAAILGLLVLIQATGNYGFFELLAATLCATLLDDRALRALTPRFLRRKSEDPSAPLEPRAELPPWRRRLAHARTGAAAVFALAVLVLTGTLGALRLGWLDRPPGPVLPLLEATAPLRSFNSYGLFANMTSERHEIVVQGSRDGVTWETYEFRWKPGDEERALRFAGVHMPRLDWQMWFAALQPEACDEWYFRFVESLLRGSPDVLGLLETNPFPDEPPRYVRSQLYDYRFSSPSERAAGRWWRRRYLRPYAPPLMLRDGKLWRAPL